MQLLENLTNLQALEPIEKFEMIALPMKLDTEGAFARVIARSLSETGV
jgi:kynurenine formamidase